MNVGDLLTPWMMLAAVLVPLIFIEGWIHSHLYGVGWLLTNDSKAATYLYYILLFPGVLMHELVQWLISGAIRVETKRVRIWPEAQKDGTLRLDFVQIKDTNPIAASVIGAAPLVVGLALVWVISNYVLNLNELVDAIGSGSLETIAAAIGDLASKPDFYFWLWLLFAISNAMLPTPADRQGWPLVIVLFVAVIAFLLIIGTGERLEQTYRESVAVGLERLSAAFSTVLVVEIPAVVLIGFSEEILERSTGRKFFYRPPVVEKKRQPGSAEPLEPGAPKPSVYLLDLPIPVPPDKPKPRRAAPGLSPAAATGTAATPRTPDARPSLTSREAPAGTSPARTSAAERPTSSTLGQNRTGSPARTSGTTPSERAGARRPAPTAARDDTARMGGTRTAGERPATPGHTQPGSPGRTSSRGDSTQLSGTRATGERPATPGRTQPGSPDRTSPRGDSTQHGSAHPTGKRPATPRRPQPGSPGRTSARPDRTASRGDSTQLGGARATGERPAQPEQRFSPTVRPSSRDRDQQPSGITSRRAAPGTPVGRPPRATSPRRVEDEDKIEDDLEYVPFDDVDYPDDDDDFYGP